MSDWGIYRGNGSPYDGIQALPAPPPWRMFKDRDRERGATFQPPPEAIEAVNTALYLRRPLLITGQPGSGKSSLAYAVAYELKLGSVLRWPITSRSTLAEGLYQYDAIGRLQEANLKQITPDIGRYIRLGPLGMALLPTATPRVLLVDEIDKSDIDLPNDLLHVFEEGEFTIPELVRLSQDVHSVDVLPWDEETPVSIQRGVVRCDAFPFVVFTSNGERTFPPAFLRRCLRLELGVMDKSRLEQIVRAHLGPDVLAQAEPLIEQFVERSQQGTLLATDQLLNALFLTSQGINPLNADKHTLLERLLRSLAL